MELYNINLRKYVSVPDKYIYLEYSKNNKPRLRARYKNYDYFRFVSEKDFDSLVNIFPLKE